MPRSALSQQVRTRQGDRSASINKPEPVPVPAGTLGPVLFGLTLRDSVLTILLFNIFSCAGPAYFAIFGPKLGQF